MKQITLKLRQKTSRYMKFNRYPAHKTITMNEIKPLFKNAGVQREPIADCNNLKYTIVQRVATRLRIFQNVWFYMHILLIAFQDFVKKIQEHVKKVMFPSSTRIHQQLSGQTYVESQLSLVLGIVLDICRF